MQSKIPGKRTIIILAVVLSIVMYSMGVLSGLFANKVIEEKVKVDIGKVEQDIDLLKTYIDTSSLDLKNMLLLQFFTENIDDSCDFSNLYMEHLNSQLGPYWERLPARLEEYEKSNKVNDEYIALKREYIRLSLRIWLTAWSNYKACDSTNFVPLLYFYSKDCKTCVKQGEVLDIFRENMLKRDKRIIGFPVDESFEDDTVYLLKQYYNITSVPAIVIVDKVMQSDIIQLPELMDAVD